MGYVDYRFIICHYYCELCFAKVSWVRHRDIHILTAGAYTYTSDQRFQALHRQNTGHSNEWSEWTLCIKWAQERDQGIYECQISTIPIKSYQFRLNVVGKFNLISPAFPPFGRNSQNAPTRLSARSRVISVHESGVFSSAFKKREIPWLYPQRD